MWLRQFAFRQLSVNIQLRSSIIGLFLTTPSATATTGILSSRPRTSSSAKISSSTPAPLVCPFPPPGFVGQDGGPFRPMIMSEIHVKCRYPHEYVFQAQDGLTKRIRRHEVPPGYISWDIPYDSYDPMVFDAHHLETAPYADPMIGNPDFHPKFNEIDGKINRKSHEGPYSVVDGRPLNIRGRTGLKGRGVLGRYGPNHAADPIVTRWARDPKTNAILIDPSTKKKFLEFVAIQRRDTGEWAIPGGMVDPGETVSVTVRREFMEEALDSGGMGASPEDLQRLEEQVKQFFGGGKEVYKGYVDDPRNTDNAWMETVAFVFHDESGDQIGQFNLKAGDDAKALKWMKLSQDLQLYASHRDFIAVVAQMLDAHW